MHEDIDEILSRTLEHRRAEKGLMAQFLNKTMPPDPRPFFVWPQLVVDVSQKRVFHTRNLVFVSVALVLATVSLTYLLLHVPFLHQSVIRLLIHGFETFVPTGFATGIAWTVGVVGMMSIGSFTNHNIYQRELQELPATKSKIYNFILKLALWEEQAFRSGSEQWSWTQRIRACMIFGVIHITNIWYSMAAGLALGLTGFGFLLVYHWYYRKTKNQVIATAASAIVHAVYNTMILTIFVIAVSIYICI